MTTERMELQPGIWLNYVKTERFKTGWFSMNMVQPLTYEMAAPNALIPSVLLRGCKKYPDMRSISQRLDELFGGSIGTLVRKKGEIQTVGFYTDFLEDRYAEGVPVFEQMMDFVRQLIFEPCTDGQAFVADYTAGEKQNLINTIDSRINDKRSYAISRLLKQMCQGETYAVPRLGEKETLEAATPDMLYRQHQNLLETSPIELFYMGQQDKDVVLHTMETMFKGMPKRTVLTLKQTETEIPQRPVQYVEEAMDVTQGKLTIGLRTPITVQDDRYLAMMLLNAIYGNGMTSKLFLKIREEQSLCYYANSSMDKFKGIMVVGSGIEFDHYQQARDGILQQLELCKQGDITDEEVESARNYLISAFQTGKDNPGRLDDYAIGQAIAGKTGSMEDMSEQLRTVTKDQIVEAANTLTLDTVYFLKGAEV